MPNFTFWNSVEKQQTEIKQIQDHFNVTGIEPSAQSPLSDGNLGSVDLKWRRKDSKLQYSTIRIAGKNLVLHHLTLGRGNCSSAVKLARDEEGTLYAVKIMMCKNKSQAIFEKNFFRESQIACDMGAAIGSMIRDSHSKNEKRYRGGFQDKKYYLVYFYTGVTIIDFLEGTRYLNRLNESKIYYDNTIGDEKLYSLGISVITKLHAINAGIQAKSKKPCLHRDVNPGNITVDAAGETHFIDYGQSESYSESDVNDAFLATVKYDIKSLLSVTFFNCSGEGRVEIFNKRMISNSPQLQILLGIAQSSGDKAVNSASAEEVVQLLMEAKAHFLLPKSEANRIPPVADILKVGATPC